VAETIPAPTDEATGIPYPIYPNPDLPPVVHPPAKNLERLGDWHHPFHPRETLVHGSLGQKALRYCRVQWTQYDEHHAVVGYHQAFDGPELPTEEADIFRTVVFAAAKFLPDKALSFSPEGEASVVPLDDDGRQRLLEGGIVKVDSNICVRDFLVDYLARNGGLLEEQRKAVERFLHTPDDKEKLFLGGALINLASRSVTASIEPVYKQARRKHNLPAQRAAKPATFVSNFLLLARHNNGSKSIQMFEESLRLAS
jgi:hypothetical protein